MIPEFEEIALFCPKAMTGGPEAMHQLSHAINQLGGRAGLLYYDLDGSSIPVWNNGRLSLRSPNAADNPLLQAYARYSPRPLEEIAISPRSLMILPEGMAPSAFTPQLGRRAIWWLSVDNAFLGDSPLKDADYRARLFADETLIHFHQSQYARNFLLHHGARRIHPLFDYIDDSFHALPSRPAEAAERPTRIAYFPRKGGALATQLMAQAPDLPFCRIENMSREEVGTALAGSTLYLDFGHHPGKDRVPREAAAAGAIVLLHDTGAGGCFGDHPLDRFYLFTRADIANGSLATRIRLILEDPVRHAAAQRHYRQKIRLEKEEFMLQVKTFFFHNG